MAGQVAGRRCLARRQTRHRTWPPPSQCCSTTTHPKRGLRPRPKRAATGQSSPYIVFDAQTLDLHMAASASLLCYPPRRKDRKLVLHAAPRKSLEPSKERSDPGRAASGLGHSGAVLSMMMRITALSVPLLRVETSGSGQAKAKPDMRRRQRTPPPPIILLGANAGRPWSRSRQFRQPFGLPDADGHRRSASMKSTSWLSQLPLQDPDRRRSHQSGYMVERLLPPSPKCHPRRPFWNFDEDRY